MSKRSVELSAASKVVIEIKKISIFHLKIISYAESLLYRFFHSDKYIRQKNPIIYQRKTITLIYDIYQL